MDSCWGGIASPGRTPEPEMSEAICPRRIKTVRKCLRLFMWDYVNSCPFIMRYALLSKCFWVGVDCEECAWFYVEIEEEPPY